MASVVPGCRAPTTMFWLFFGWADEGDFEGFAEVAAADDFEVGGGVAGFFGGGAGDDDAAEAEFGGFFEAGV